MKAAASFFQLIRWKNLVIVFLTQWAIWYCVVHPIAMWKQMPLFLNAFHFLLLSLSTILIAAAGYIINDYFDVKIDIINRPQKVIIDRVISRRNAMLWHSFLNISGLGIAAFLAFKLDMYGVLLIQICCTILLWFYSTSFKRQFVVGNLVVAVLTALTILILGVFEPLVHQLVGFSYFLEFNNHLIVNPFWVIVIYAYFAFMLTWMREIVKDMEDYKGDAEDGCVTMPIKVGLKASTTFTIILGILALIPLVIASVKLILGTAYILGCYIVAAIVVPLFLWIFFLKKQVTTAHYALCSKYLKYIMLTGIFSLVIYYITL